MITPRQARFIVQQVTVIGGAERLLGRTAQSLPIADPQGLLALDVQGLFFSIQRVKATRRRRHLGVKIEGYHLCQGWVLAAVGSREDTEPYRVRSRGDGKERRAGFCKP